MSAGPSALSCGPGTDLPTYALRDGLVTMVRVWSVPIVVGLE